MAKVVSSIVSAYFAEQYLAGRLENLMAQDPQPQIVVICQAESKELEIARNYPGVKIIETPDIPSIYSAWNTGIQAAGGKYLISANCDDRLLPGALANMAGVLDENPKYAAVYGNQDIVKEIGGAVTGKYEWAEGDLERLLEACFLGPMPMWRKSLHDKYGYFDAEMQSAGDYEFWLRMAAGGEKFFHLRETVGIYLDDRRSAGHRQKVRSVWETARARARYRKGIGLWQY